MNLKEITQSMIETKRDIEYIKCKLDDVPTIEGMKLANKELIEEVFLEADKRYASKVTEKIVYSLAGAIMLFVLNGLLGLIEK